MGADYFKKYGSSKGNNEVEDEEEEEEEEEDEAEEKPKSRLGADYFKKYGSSKLNNEVEDEQEDEEEDEEEVGYNADDDTIKSQKKSRLGADYFRKYGISKMSNEGTNEHAEEQAIGIGIKDKDDNNTTKAIIKNSKKKIKLLPPDESRTENECNDETRQKKKHNLIINSTCVRTMELTPVWRRLLPSRTSWIVWDNSKNLGCNFNLLKYILRTHDCQKYQTMEGSNLKKMLIQFYNKYIKGGEYDEITKQLYGKWKKEAKAHLSLKRTSIENIIEDENYVLSKTDLVLVAHELNLPITVLYEFKGEVKITSFSGHNNSGVNYFVKIASRTNQLYLAARAKSIIFEERDLNDNFKQIINNKKLTDFSEYLSSK